MGREYSRGSDDASASLELLERFAAAWNRHDATALARLFVADADFVNVVGIWWRDRCAIEEAHAFFNLPTVSMRLS